MSSGVPLLILAVSWTETALGVFFYVLRIISNWKFVHRWRWDFILATATVVTQFVAQIFLQLAVDEGMGRHMGTLEPGEIVTSLKWGWVYQLLSIAASTMGKLAILAFLVQIRGWHDNKPWALIALGSLIAAVNITVIGTILGQCTPMEKLWDDSVEGTCDPGRQVNQNYSFFQASFNTFCDALLASYPAYLFWKLQMKLRIKIGLSILMGLGWIAAACSAVKCYELEVLTTTEDVTYALHSLLIWASTESWIIVIVGCVPPCRPLLERVLQVIGLSSSRKTTSNTPYGGKGYGAYAQFGDRSGGNRSHVQSNAFGGRGPLSRDDGDTWVELNATGANSSKEQIIHGKNVMVTTDIMTQYEARPDQQSPSGSHISREDLSPNHSSDMGKVL